jgi:hypothetical protein
MYMCMHMCMSVLFSAILMLIEGRLQAFQRLSSSKLVLKTVQNCFTALHYYENGSPAVCTIISLNQLSFFYGFFCFICVIIYFEIPTRITFVFHTCVFELPRAAQGESATGNTCVYI